MSLLILSAADVDAIASTLSPQDLQFLMAQVFFRLSRKDSLSMPARITFPTANHTALFMPARIGPPPLATSSHESTNLGDTAIKVVCVPRKGDSHGLPGTTLILDEETGAVKAIVNSRKLTALRNAAGSLLSTSLVGPSNPRTVVAFGAGQQIASHLDLHIRHFPSITQCIIVNRTLNDRAISLREKLIRQFSHIRIELITSNSNHEDENNQGSDSSSIQKAVGTADIIICATSSTAPLFPSSWVKTRTHVILIGSYTPSMREVDKALVYRTLGRPESAGGVVPNSRFPVLLVDSRDACLHEAGELIEAQIIPEQMSELGELIPKDEAGKLDVESYRQLLSIQRLRDGNEEYEGPITMFKSVGIGLQDVAIASAIVDKALSLEEKIGTRIIDYDCQW